MFQHYLTLHSTQTTNEALGDNKLSALLAQALDVDSAERIALFGRWWFDAESGQLVLSAFAAGLLDVHAGLHRTPEACFSQVVADDAGMLSGVLERMRRQETVIDSVVRVINELDGMRWLRVVSLPRDREMPGVRRGMLINVTAAQHAAMRERLGFESTQFLVGAHSSSEAISMVIKSVCENLGWDWGAYWNLEKKSSGHSYLVCQYYWHTQGLVLDAFTHDSCALQVDPGNGLVGRVWQTGRAMWGDSAVCSGDCLRSQSIHASGLRSAYAFPVTYLTEDGQQHSPGVLEFCSSLPRQREAQLPNLSNAIGALVAQALQRIEQTETIRKMAQVDAMTGLANRSHFHQLLGAACQQAQGAGASFGVLFVDLDRFKPINDAYGHDAGNMVILEFSRRMAKLVPEGSHVGRLGGDEFAILSPQITAQSQLDALAIQVLEAASQTFYLGHLELAVSASIGISVFPENGKTPPELLRCADAAMYRSKNHGRSSHCFYSSMSPTFQPGIEQQLELEAALHQALMTNEFFLEYQPVFDCFGESMVAVEALIRWRRASGEVLRPDTFIPVAERSQLIVLIGRWVMRQACQDLAIFQRAGFRDLQVNINMAPDEFIRERLPDDLMAIVREAGVKPRHVCLELTESMAMRQSDKVIPVMRALRQSGFHISLDDFGMGHSSLSRLKSLPITSLKIDRSFVRGLPNDTGDCSIVRAIFDLGKHMKLQVIAEGVESDAQFSYLRQFGYPWMQGFLLSRPMPAECLLELFPAISVSY
ncbi:MAG: EAL domain-containing protein [Oxalobacter sp.]|nr:MAG: EAL domain-containing protein [Oxalobacter sp.]